LAQKIDIPRLKGLIGQGTHGPVQADAIINQLREAIDYIKSDEKNFPDTVLFRAFIGTQKKEFRSSSQKKLKLKEKDSASLSDRDA
jgi:hypothetical protein